MAILVPVCIPCSTGDHSSHDDHQGFGGLGWLTPDQHPDLCQPNCKETP